MVSVDQAAAPPRTRWETLEAPEALSLPELPKWALLDWQRTRPLRDSAYRELAHRPRHRAVLRVRPRPSIGHMVLKGTHYLITAGAFAIGLPWIGAAGAGAAAVELTTAAIRTRRGRFVIDERGVTVRGPGLRIGRADRTGAIEDVGRPEWVREETGGDDTYAVRLDLGTGEPVHIVEAVHDPREAQVIQETVVRLVDHFQRSVEG